jgi:aryl-alcohol dehydrogenase-like predicted oxidoreductase
VLAWLLAQDDHVIALPGTKRVAYLEENAQAIGIALSEEELASIDAAMPSGSAQGLRYPEGQMSRVQL